MNRALLTTALSVGLALSTNIAFACGGAFSPGTQIEPNQDILLVHKAGVETYEFQPTACGTAASFGLLLPVPSMLSSSPSLGQASTFTSLATIAQPTQQTVTECVNTRGEPEDGGASLGASPGGTGGPTVVASGQVGFLDWVQVKADTVQSFTDWLDANGYPYDAASTSTFSYYVSNGWYFVAFKMGQSAPGYVCDSLGPIQLSFPTATPYVPARIVAASTSSDAGSAGLPATLYSWRIFAISEGTSQLATDSSWQPTLGFSGALSAASAASLDSLAVAGDRLTETTVRFSGASVSSDIEFTRQTPVDYRATTTVYEYVDCSADGGPVTVSGDGGAAANGDAGSIGHSPPPGGCNVAPGAADSSGSLLFALALAGQLARSSRRRRG